MKVTFRKNEFGQPNEEAAVRKQILAIGFDPILICDPAGVVYSEHSHPETKLLAFLKGSMKVQVEGKLFDCQTGDLLIIPGSQIHSAVVGEKGCEFYWSEKKLKD